jgi:hypothetical protein
VVRPDSRYGLTGQSPLPGGVRAELRAGQTMFWDGETTPRVVLSFRCPTLYSISISTVNSITKIV